MSEHRVYCVKLGFPLEKGRVTWTCHVTAGDTEAASRLAADLFWSEMGYSGPKPQPTIEDVFEDPAGLLPERP